MAVYKVNVSLSEALVSDIDETAETLGLTRSGFIAEASARYIADVRNLSEEELRRKDIARARQGFREIREGLPSDYEFDYLGQIRADRRRRGPGGSHP